MNFELSLSFGGIFCYILILAITVPLRLSMYSLFFLFYASILPLLSRPVSRGTPRPRAHSLGTPSRGGCPGRLQQRGRGQN